MDRENEIIDMICDIFQSMTRDEIRSRCEIVGDKVIFYLDRFKFEFEIFHE